MEGRRPRTTEADTGVKWPPAEDAGATGGWTRPEGSSPRALGLLTTRPRTSGPRAPRRWAGAALSRSP